MSHVDTTLMKHGLTNLLGAELGNNYETYLERKLFKGLRLLILSRQNGEIVYEGSWIRATNLEALFRWPASNGEIRSGLRRTVALAIQSYEQRRDTLVATINPATHTID